MSVRGHADLFQYAAANAPGNGSGIWLRLRAEAARMWCCSWTTCCCSPDWTRRGGGAACGGRTRI